eukprot:69639_1
MADQIPNLSKKQQAFRNWRSWENLFRKVSQKVAIDGTTAAVPGAKQTHIIKLSLYYIIFTASFYLLNGFRLPSFDKLSFIKLLLYCITAEALGFGCCSGILGGHMPYKYPLSWHNITVGTCKLPTLTFLGGRIRGALDVTAYIIYICLLLYLYIFTLDADGLHRNAILFVIFIFLSYFWIFDRIVFLSSRPEYYGTYLLCMCFSSEENKGWLAAAQILQISVWFWAGVSKLGVWFDYVVPLMTANSPFKPLQLMYDPLAMHKMYRNYPNDLRPSAAARKKARFGVVLEIAAGLLMIAPQTRLYGVLCSLLLHSFIIVSFPVGAVQEWNVANISFSLYLFHVNGDTFGWIFSDSWSVIANEVKVILFIASFCVPLLCNIFPDAIDFLLGMRYYAGNWENGTWIVKKKTWDAMVVPNLVSLNKSPVSGYPCEMLPSYGFRLICTPTGKALLNLMKDLVCEHWDDIGYKLDCDEYLLLCDGIVTNWLYGWGWHWTQNNLLTLRAALDEKGTGISAKIDQYDIMMIYVKSVPTFTFLKPASFNWAIYDFDANIISKGSSTLKEIDDTPHFEAYADS